MLEIFQILFPVIRINQINFDKIDNFEETDQLNVKQFTEVLLYLNEDVLNEENWDKLQQKLSGKKLGHTEKRG